MTAVPQIDHGAVHVETAGANVALPGGYAPYAVGAEEPVKQQAMRLRVCFGESLFVA